MTKRVGKDEKLNLHTSSQRQFYYVKNVKISFFKNLTEPEKEIAVKKSFFLIF